MKVNDQNIYIYRPAGNDTALVEGSDFSTEKRQKINADLLKTYPNVEQVGFISTTGLPQLMMAGGEFCGNASRSAAYHYLKGKDGVIDLRVCDGTHVIRAGVSHGEAFAEIPLRDTLEKTVKKLASGVYQVDLLGIELFVIDGWMDDPAAIMESAKIWLEKLDHAHEECQGIIFIKENQIAPVIKVKAINTLYYETACGSGSVAVALVEYFKKKTPVQLRLKQPSGQWITAQVDQNGAQISGLVTQLSSFKY